MRDDVLAYLRCPSCEGRLTRAGGTVRCPLGHHFDIARQGYVNLLAGRTTRHTGDTAEMVAARDRFLARGHYDFVVDAITALVDPCGLVADVGAGTGHYLASVLTERSVGLALDVSVAATRRAARAHPRASAVVADVWHRLPIADGSVSLLLDVFAPRNGPEFRRVLRADGLLVVVTPTAEHLGELVSALDLLAVDPAKPERLAASLDADFTKVAERTVRRTMWLSRDEIAALVGMGPSAHHRHGEPTDQSVTAAVQVSAYRAR